MDSKSVAVCAAVAALSFACSSNGPDGEERSELSTGGTSGTEPIGGAGSGANPGSGGTSFATGGGLIIVDDPGTGGTPGSETLTEDDTCAALALEPQPVEHEEEITTTITTEVPAPVAIYLVLDNSMSMDSSSELSTDSKWEEAVDAITTFVNDPNSADIDVAIQYFHPQGVATQADECDGIAHATPAVPAGRLPDHASAIVDSLGSAGPESNTPTVGALTGATAYCAAFEAQNPDEQCVVVLVTDGQPNGCGLSARCDTGGGRGSMDCVDPNAQAELTAIAADGLTSGVVTFTVGMAGVTDEGFGLLDAIAIAGGSDCSPGEPGAEACNVSATGSAGFLNALNAIRDSISVTETTTETITTVETTTVPCQWTIPAPATGEELDPNLINVNVSYADVTEAIVSVATADDCALAQGHAWYYDDPANPAVILACPQTCEFLSSDAAASVEVLFGCTRIEIIQ
jgi:hypothetical protein